MKVNMTPNPLDVVTIHASQGDSEARQWEFELHNNGELIDTSEITEQLFFKAYKGGTEQILPTNGSVPVTAPFLGDIRYPQGLLTDQEFTYRQSPTEEDGLAKITDIKGNTLVWNQLFKIYVPDSVTTNGVTLVTNADGTATLNGTATARTAFVLTAVATSNGLLASNHIYYMAVCPKGGSPNTYFGGVAGLAIDTGNGGIWKYNYTWDSSSLRIDIVEGVTFNNVSFKPQYIDLTLLFGTEKAEEILAMGQTNGVAYFRSLFSLSYYSYNQGSLLSFSGNGIKTVGFNQWDGNSENGKWINDYSTGAVSTAGSTYNATDFIRVFPNTTYYHTKTGSRRMMFYDGNKNPIPMTSWEYPDDAGTIVSPPNAHYIRFTITNDYLNNFCFNISDQSKDGTYEPYTESVLSLPISTYFPNGMKSAGSVYDELTDSKAIARIGAVDLGSLDWGVSNGTMYANLPGAYLPSTGATVANAICPKYTTAPLNYVIAKSQDKILALNNGQPRVNVYDSAYTDATAFKTAMSGVYLYYELATPTETSFTTASLVTENAEIPLSAENDVLIGKCTEELSSQPGFIDAKIKLTDGDGTCYSNKIQLHVERKP